MSGMRYYMDILNESAAVEQLDEALMQDVKAKISQIMSKVKNLPNFAQEYQQAKAATADLKQIFQSGQSGQQVVDAIKKLTGAQDITQQDLQNAQRIAEDYGHLDDVRDTMSRNYGKMGGETYLWIAAAFMSALLAITVAAATVIDVCQQIAKAGNFNAAWFLVAPVLYAFYAIAKRAAQAKKAKQPR